MLSMLLKEFPDEFILWFVEKILEGGKDESTAQVDIGLSFDVVACIKNNSLPGIFFFCFISLW